MVATSTLLGHVAARTGVAIWRHRLVFVGAAIVTGALAAFSMTSAAGPTVVDGDCADTTMSAVTNTTDASARAAYACLNAGMRSTPEDAFVANMRQHSVPHGQFSRVGEKHTTDGGNMVFYAVDADGQSVGYIVYLDPQGRVRGLE
jgi:hypothetical protein